MMYDHYPIPLDITLHEFLTKILSMEELSSPVQHSLSLELFEKFKIAGCKNWIVGRRDKIDYK